MSDLPLDLPIIAAMAEEQPVSEQVRSLGTMSRLLSYPDEHYSQLVEMLYLIVQSPLSEAARGISQFGQFSEQCDEFELEETYTRTFDVNPSCALEIGWHLYGEDYRRGAFLVQMRQSLAEENLPESGELPDHISHCLLLLAQLDLEDGREFTKSYLLPAIEKIRRGFKDKETNPYRNVVDVLHAVLRRNYDIADRQHPALKVLNNGPRSNANHQVNDNFIV